MRFRRNLMGAAALAASLALVAGACGSDDDGGAADTTAAGAETTAAGAETTAAAGGDTTAAAGGDTTAPAATGECQPGTGTVEPIATAEADGTGKTMGLLFDVTGRGDKSFNDGAAAGMDKAAEDFGIETDESEPTGDAVSAGAYRRLRRQGPDRRCRLPVDRCHDRVGDGEPRTALRHRRPDGSHRAAQRAKHLLRRGARLVPRWARLRPVRHRRASSASSAVSRSTSSRSSRPASRRAPSTSTRDATVEVQYITQPPDFTGFTDPAKGKAIATAMYDSGIDVIYAAAGGSGSGLFEAALESGKEPGEIYAIGVDSDQYEAVAPSCSRTSSRRPSSGWTWPPTRPSPTC